MLYPLNIVGGKIRRIIVIILEKIGKYDSVKGANRR